MAAPAVQTADTKNGTQTSNSTSWTGTYPTNLAAGDLILMAVAADGGGLASATDWTRIMVIQSVSGAVSLSVLAKVATGSESGTFTITISASEQGAWRAYRITGWYGGSLTAGGPSQTDANGESAYGAGSPSTDQNPDPPLLNPANWDIEECLWVVFMAADTSRTVSAYPSNFPDLRTADVSGGSTGATLGAAMVGAAAQSINPNTFTISASDDWAAATVAIRPAASGPQTVTPALLGQAADVPAPKVNQQLVGTLAGQALDLLAPSITQRVVPALLGQASDAPAPAVFAPQFLTLDLLGQASDAPAPKVNQQVVATLLDDTLGTVAPNVQRSIALTLLGAALDAPAPTVIGAQTITLGLLGQALDVAAPKLNQQVVASLLGQALDGVAPKLDQQVVASLLGQVLGNPAPQVNWQIRLGLLGSALDAVSPQANQQVVASLLGQLLDVPAPVVAETGGGPQTVQPGLLGQALTSFDPAINQQVVATLLGSALGTAAPTARLSVAPALLGSALGVASPQFNQRVVGALLGQELDVNARRPTILPLQKVLPGALGQALAVAAPTVVLVILPIVHRIGRRLVQMHAFIYSGGANGGPNQLKLDLTPEMLNAVWQRSLNLSGQAAFTLPRSSSKVASILPGQDHLALWRETPSGGARLVFQGKVASILPGPGDAIFRAIDYLGYLQRSRTGYRTLYPSKKIGTEIIAPEWALAKGADRSPLEFVATGTIQDPLALDGVTPMKTNSKYGLVYFDRLFTFFALAEMAMANTSNNVVFEITLSATAPTFNFWKNRVASRTDPVLSWPGNLVSFNYAPGHDEIITDLATVIKKAAGGQEGYELAAASGLIDTYRRLQSAVTIETLMGLDTNATETDQMKAALARLLANATRLPRMFVALPRYAEVDPFNGWDLGDSFPVFVEKIGQADADEVSGYLRLISIAGSWRPDAGEQLVMYLRGQ